LNKTIEFFGRWFESKSENNTLTSQHVREMGLDPSGDELFVRELIDTYNLNVHYNGSGCCS